MRLSIRYQLLFPLLSLMLFAAGMTAWLGWSAAERERVLLDEQMDAMSATVRKATFPLNQRILLLMKEMSRAEFLIVDARGVTLPGDAGQSLTTLATPPESRLSTEPSDSAPGSRPPRIVIAGEEYFSRRVPLSEGADPHRVLYILYPVSLWRDALWQAVRPALAVGIIGGLASIVLTLLATHRWTRRIQALEKQTRRIAEGDFSPMATPAPRDELGDLASSVNDMAQQLARFQDAARRGERLALLGQVSGGLAHQLRNAVAGAKLAVQLAARQKPGSEELSVALRQLAIMEHQLQRFLDLGKAVELQRTPCSLRDLIGEAAALLKPRCDHARIRLGTTCPQNDRSLLLDAAQIGHAIMNLATNAVDAVGAEGEVEIRLTHEPARSVVEVFDTGPGPDPSLADRLFEPFITGKPEGVGLGLAVAKRIAEAHHGAITWSRGNGRTCFRLDLPVNGATSL